MRTIKDIKKEFEERFGDKHSIHIPSQEIWEFFLPYLKERNNGKK
jgi:hypothetical protein